MDRFIVAAPGQDVMHIKCDVDMRVVRRISGRKSIVVSMDGSASLNHDMCRRNNGDNEPIFIIYNKLQPSQLSLYRHLRITLFSGMATTSAARQSVC